MGKTSLAVRIDLVERFVYDLSRIQFPVCGPYNNALWSITPHTAFKDGYTLDLEPENELFSDNCSIRTLISRLDAFCRKHKLSDCHDRLQSLIREFYRLEDERVALQLVREQARET